MSTTVTAEPSFAATRTHRNLITAGQGEHRAQRLYLLAAQRMDEADLHVIAHAFHFTAAQEKEHAAIFRGLLTAYGGHSLPLVEDSPLLLPREPLAILHAVAQNETDEWDKLYPAHARTAEREGFPRIAEAFRRIAETEQLHARRFAQYEQSLADGALFHAPQPVGWLCLPCGQMHYGQDAPRQCSTCGRARGQFIRSCFHPFTVE